MRLKKITPTVKIICAACTGMAAGSLLQDNAAPLGDLGKIVIQLIKMVAVPLLFLIITHSVATTHLALKDGRKLLFVVLVNSICAIIIGMGLVHLIQPGTLLHNSESLRALSLQGQGMLKGASTQKINFLETFKSYIPSNFFEPFLQSSIMNLIVLALLVGFALRSLKNNPEHKKWALQCIEHLEGLTALNNTILSWVILLVPFGVFGITAKTVGEYGFAPFKALLVFVALVVTSMILHALLVYQSWIHFYAKKSLHTFWHVAWAPMTYAFGTNSSLATLPITLKSLKDYEVSQASSTLGACIGTNLNNDGIILYEGAALLFLAQFYGLDLSWSQELLVIVTAMVAAMGVAGVPEAGFVSLTLVVNTVGLPIEALPLLLAVDWILARCRSVLNVLSDMTVSIAVDSPQS